MCIYIYITCVSLYTYIYIERERCRSLSLSIYIYIHIHVISPSTWAARRSLRGCPPATAARTTPTTWRS